MQANLLNVTYEVELKAGEQLSLPVRLVETIGAGRWIITIRPSAIAGGESVMRDHTAFLNSYAPEDEGLYDDAPIG